MNGNPSKALTTSPADGAGLPWSLRGGTHGDYGVELNCLTVDELFDAYRRHNFIYPAKAARLAPYLAVIKHNWERALRSDGELFWFATHSNKRLESWASIASWRSTNDGWLTQHLVSSGNPVGSLAVMLSSLVVRYSQHTDQSHQNWFQPKKKFPRRVFGSIENELGADLASVRSYHYMSIGTDNRLQENEDSSIRVLDATDDPGLMKAVCQLARDQRGDIYVQAEQLHSDDVGLRLLDETYRKVGLRRYRRVIVATRSAEEAPFFAAMAWRGPLGMNFSFLENRCDILAMDSQSAQDGLAAVWPQLRGIYSDFEPSFIPLVVDSTQVDGMRKHNAQETSRYSQSIWMRDGFPAWYNHVASMFPRFDPVRSNLTEDGATA